MSKSKKVGGRKEAPLAVVGSSGFGEEQYTKVLTPEDVDFHRFSEVLKGYFEKFARWQGIAKQEKYLRSRHPFQYNSLSEIASEDWKSEFEVLLTPQGMEIGIVHSEPDYDGKPNRLLHAEVSYDHNLPDKDGKYGTTMVKMRFKSGLAGEQLFVDPDNNPLKEVHIDINSYRSGTWRELSIFALSPNMQFLNEPGAMQRVVYTLKNGAIEISNPCDWLPAPFPMPETYSTTLLNTVDALIPGLTPPTPQNERRVKQERQKPKAPSAQRRRTRRG